MGNTDRAGSVERTVVRHVPTPDGSRAGIPMWDSSDPDRAPPPLPLRPCTQSPTKPNTSSAIAAAAQQIIERARESTPISSYTSNASPLPSPERSLVKGAHHKRMQSLQTGSVKDLRSYIDSNRSPERSPERPDSRNSIALHGRENSRDLSPIDRSVTPTPASKDMLKETPTLRPSTRPPPRPLLGENTPPSSTMLALQTMKVPDDVMESIVPRPSTPTTPRMSTTYDFSSQLLNLTSIATNLQKEMAAISRRSKDNATDLLSLKEATLKRDEDIRSSLKDLSSNMNTSNLLGPPPSTTRNGGSYGGLFLDSKAFNSPPSATKSWTTPRVASVPNLAEDSRVGSPSPYSVDGAASIAMLEKVIREMASKEGQERLLLTLNELFEKNSKTNAEAARKVEELATFIKERPVATSLVPVSQSASGAPQLDLSFDSPQTKTSSRRAVDQPVQTDDEVFKLLQRIKDSISHVGGTSAEVKASIRDMRGEVLGMGRDLGKKLDQVSESQLNNTLDRSIATGQSTQDQSEVYRVLEEGLNEIRDHISNIFDKHSQLMDTRERQITPSQVDKEQMYTVVSHALSDHSQAVTPLPQDNLVSNTVLDAVKEGLKDFEPNIELQQFGLERDEILAVLKEGLEDYQRSKSEPTPLGIDKGEIYEMMQEALKDFQPSQAPYNTDRVREETLADVRLALAAFQASAETPQLDHEMIRLAVADAVKEGLVEHGPAAPRELEISREDLFDAVKSSLDGTSIPFNSLGEQVLERLQALVDGLGLEFKQYSAANGRDTEQVLDAIKDGLDSLRVEIEQYVDRAQDVTGKDEIVHTMRSGIEQLRDEMQGLAATATRNDSASSEMLDYLKAEFEHLHEVVGTTRDMREPATDHSISLLQALQTSVDALQDRRRSRGVSIGESDDSREEVFEAMKDEFEQLKTAILHGHATDKSVLIETIQDTLGSLHTRLNGSDISSLSSNSADELLSNIRQEFAEVKNSLGSTMDEGDRDVILTGVKRTINDLRVQLAADQSDAAAEAIGAIREELKKFREGMHGQAVSGNIITPVSLAAVELGLENIREQMAKTPMMTGVSEELLESIRGEFESVRNAISHQPGSHEEVVDIIRVGLDDLRSSLEKKIDSPERQHTQQTELLDVMSEGLETLRADVLKTLDKPLDMTVNYEILDTLKSGLTSLRAEIDSMKPTHLRADQVVLADGGVIADGSRGLSAADGDAPTSSATKSSTDRVEVMLTQLQIKVEAMSVSLDDNHHNHSGPANAATREDLESIETSLKDLQETILVIAEKDVPISSAPEGAATKADTDAIETLLRNTKAHLEDTMPQDTGSLATKEHIESVEGIVALTSEVVESLKDKIDDTVAAKTDVVAIEMLTLDVKKTLEELKERVDADISDEHRMTKVDLDVLGVICTDIKTRIMGMDLPSAAEAPSKADIEQLQGLISDFRESHDKLRESYESDIAITAKAFDDRKEEYDNTTRQLDDVRTAVADAKMEIMDLLTSSESGLHGLHDNLRAMTEKANTDSVSLDIAEVIETVKAEFEKSHGSLESLKVDHEHNAMTALEKQGEHRDAVIAEIGERLDTLFDGLMSKYDDAQAAANETTKALEEKTVAQDALFLSTKDMTDELKLSIDTLGTSMTAFTATYPDQMEKLVDDSKLVFNRVDDAYNKLDETQSGLQHEHTVTREEVLKVMSALQTVHNDINDHNPRFMVSLKEIQALISQHYEHSQKAAQTAEQHAQAVRDLQSALKNGFEDAKGHHTSQAEALKGALPALLPAPVEGAVNTHTAYDDSAMHTKLDEMMGHVKSTAHLEKLNEMHEKLIATTAEMSTFMSQSRQQDGVTSNKDINEDAIHLERRTMQRDQLEADIAVLDEEKESLQAEVDALRAERDSFLEQKIKAATELSSIETALQIRKEELHHMESKAEAIERRMLEGVMNQSRMLLLAKATRAQPTARKETQGRDLRIISNGSAVSTMTSSTMPPLQANHALALKTRPQMNRNNLAPNTTGRRIMSLSQINHNVPTGASAFHQPQTLLNKTSNGLQRSHSVKTGYARKASWGGTGQKRMSSGFNKENETLSEEDEEDDDFQSVTNRDDDDFESDAGTERRSSLATPFDLSTIDESKLNYGGSDLTYETGSYMTGSDVDGRTSLGSTMNGKTETGSVMNKDDQQDEVKLGADREGESRTMLRLEPPPTQKNVYAPPSDSGIGTELLTADHLSPSEHDSYFKEAIAAGNRH